MANLLSEIETDDLNYWVYDGCDYIVNNILYILSINESGYYEIV